MKTNPKTQIWTGLCLAVMAASPALAGYDEKYPAYDFKPSVIYRDPALTGQSATATPEAEPQAPDPKYPAAHFIPSVIHPAKAADVHTPDPKYPAAYFTPSVIYPAK
jgi:hypothetical protein